jgi:DNA (cytosine-5)-methyltransferase 1
VNHLSLFSGVGGLDLAAEWAGFTTIGFVERDKFCQRVLAKHWPGVPIWDDVAEVTADAFRQRSDAGASGSARDAQGNELGDDSAGERGRDAEQSWAAGSSCDVGLISGGFPCQPHSVAGLRKGSTDERDLWSECARIVGEFRPRWCVFENVPGLLSSEGGSFFARVLGDLAALGYGVGWATYGAVDVGAPHRRDRVFIVAHSGREGVFQRWIIGNAGRENAVPDGMVGDGVSQGGRSERKDLADAGSAGREERDPAAVADGSGHGAWCSDASGRCWESEPAVGRVAHGIPRRVDRLRALGNAVVPQQAYPIFRAIAEIEGIYRG